MISEAKNRSLIISIPDIIFVLDREGTFINYHAHSIDEFLVPPSVFLGKKIADVLPNDIAIVTMQNIAKVLSTGETQVFDYRLFLNGGYSNYEARMAVSNVDEVLVIARNITERKTAEIEIRQREEKYRSIFANSPVGIFTFNQQSELIDCNENFVDIIGSSKESLLGLNLLENLKDNKLKTALEEALNKGSSYYEDNHFSIIANKETPVKIFLKTINDTDGKFIEGVGICEDITGQKIYEKEIINAREKAEQSDKMKSAFMATMSHELRTPLNAVIGFSEMIDTSLPTDQIEEFSQIISKSGRHLLTIIEDIFDITSIESGEIKPHIEKVAINDTMKYLYQICLNEKNRVHKDHLTVILNIPSDLEDLKISTDIPKFHKLLFHLLNNAIKFTKEGTIEFGFTTETVSHNPRNLLFYVKDTGIGIPIEKQQVIFDIFRQADETSTREFEGTGLGLSISKRLIELLGGNIWLESTIGTGSQFYFELPCLDTTFNIMDFLRQQNQPKDSQGENLVVLVAEDDDTNYQLFDLLLRRKKFRIIRASNGEEAVNKFSENPDISLVLMDINMPIMNGYDATRALKKIRAEVPVIAITAYALSGDDLKAVEAGCNDYLSKPINNKLFYDTIFKYI
jgi:PAS domain S-box-containing protein